MRYPARRQGLRQRRDPSADRSRRGCPEYPAQGQPTPEAVLLARTLSRPQRNRAHVRPPQGLPSDRDPLRQARGKLPRCRLRRRNRQLPVMSLEPTRVVE